MGKLSAGRELALRACAQVRERDAYVDNVVNSMIHRAKLPHEERAFAELLATGVTQTVGTLDEIIDRNLNHPNDIDPEVRDALRISVYELVFLGKQAHAVVDQGVELVKLVAPKAAGLGNKVLHRILDDVRAFPWGNPNTDDDALARKTGFPYWLGDLLVDALGHDAAVVFMATSNQPAPLYLAVNQIKAKPEEVLRILNDSGADAAFVGPAERGCILVRDQRAAIRSGVLKGGRALVSDASAQLTALVATPSKGGRFLEIGSGRGTKTVMLQSNALVRNGEQARVWCVDKHAFKKDVLAKRSAEYGLENVHVLSGDATDLDSIAELPKSFDGILIDAPCSGLGTLRRNHDIRWRLEASDIDAMAEVQLAMLKSAAPRVAPGGFIVYSTCTVTREENGDVIKRFLASEEGRGFALEKIGGREMVMGTLRPGGPDVHFMAKLVRA